MKHMNPELGLHGLGQDNPFQWSYLTKQCQEVVRHLDRLIEVSWDKVPMRQGGFDLNVDPKAKVPWKPGVNDLTPHDRAKLMDPSMRERILEYKILQYGKDKKKSPVPVLDGVCNKIQSYQVPLCRERAPKGTNYGWKAIDLLGSTVYSLPLIVELKCDNVKDVKRTNETPLRMIVEAAAYGVALRKMWEAQKSPFKEEWRKERYFAFNEEWRKKYELKLQDRSPLSCRLVGLAPATYWERAFGKLGKGGEAPEGFWQEFKNLCEALESKGLPVTLASVRLDSENQIVGLDFVEPPVAKAILL